MDILGLGGGRKFSRDGASLYSELELPKGANPEEIKRQYRKLALKYHPDKNPGDESAVEKFKSINRAHRTLTDPKKRDIYNKYGSFGLHLADQLGEENVGTYAALSSWWCQALFFGCGILTGCYFCCCLCCCCNCCCGKCCKSKEEEDVPTADDLEMEFNSQGGDNNDTHFIIYGNSNEPIINQPHSNSSPIFVIPMSS